MSTEVSHYIKKLLVFIILSAIGVFTIQFVPAYMVIPVLLLVLSFIHERTTDEKPPYLFTMTKIDDFINSKGGFWNFFKILVNLFGILYDIVVRMIWGVYILFSFVLDLISLVKEVLYWIVHAIIWFLKLLVPPILFLYKTIIHYFIKWIWWIYQLTFKNIAVSVNFNYLIISFFGSAIALFLIFLFLYLDILTGTRGLIFIGIVLATLPVAWAFGEISATREQNLQKDRFADLRMNFENGVESVKWMLYFIFSFLALFVIQVALDLFGWMPSAGLSVLGFSLNVNTFISILLILLSLLTLFATFMIPTHLLNTEEQESWFFDVLAFVKAILWKGLRYLFSMIPSGFFGIILMIIPAVLVYFSFVITDNVKNTVIERKINQYQQEIRETTSERSAYPIRQKVRKLKYYQTFPENILTEAQNWRNIDAGISKLDANIGMINENLSDIRANHRDEIDQLNEQLEAARQATDPNQENLRVNVINSEINSVNREFQVKRDRYLLQRLKYQEDKKYLLNLQLQLPFVLFFAVLWIAVFGGLVIAFYISYMGNVFYKLYRFREDDKPTYFAGLIHALNQKDQKQPLLGFTCLIVVIIIGIALINLFVT